MRASDVVARVPVCGLSLVGGTGAAACLFNLWDSKLAQLCCACRRCGNYVVAYWVGVP